MSGACRETAATNSDKVLKIFKNNFASNCFLNLFSSFCLSCFRVSNNKIIVAVAAAHTIYSTLMTFFWFLGRD